MAIHKKQHDFSSNTDHIFTGLTNSELLRLNSTGTAVESAGVTPSSFLNISGGTVTGQTNFTSGLSANTLSGGTILSGSTNLYSIFLTSGSLTPTYVQNGLNTYTAGTISNPTVNISAATLSTLNVSGATSLATLSATTMISGSTNLYSIFATTGSGVQSVGATGNLSTGGTVTNPTINLAASPSFGGLSVSGTTNVSSGAIQSGGTDLYSIFVDGVGTTNTLPLWSNGTGTLTNSIITQSGTGVTVAGSVNIIGDVNVLGTASTFNTQIVQSLDNNILLNYSGSNVSAIGGGITVLSGTPSGVASTWSIDSNGVWSANTGILTSAVTVSNGNLTVNGGGAMISGSTNLYQIFATAGSGVQSVGANGNLSTGGTATNPTINLAASPSFNSVTASGSSTFNGGLSANTLSGGTILSGSTNLYSIFLTAGSLTPTYVQNGLNTYTGGSINNPTVNISAATLSTLNVSGATSLATLSATTMISGSTNLYAIFAQTGSGVQTVGQGTNIATGGTVSNPTISTVASPSFNALTASGATTINNTLNVTGATTMAALTTTGATIIRNTLTVTGATTLNNTLNVTGATTMAALTTTGATIINSTLTVTGVTNTAGLSASTLSGGTILSGSTNLYAIFAQTGSGVQTVGQGTNITTGGTVTNPTISTVASPSFNALTASGATSLATLSATTMISGSTNLYNIFATTGSGVQTVGQGTNIATGGTVTNPTISTTASLTVNAITASGSSNFSAGLSASTLSGGTILSGSTNLYSIFVDGVGTTNVLPLWLNGTGTLTDSIITQSSTGVTVAGSVNIIGDVNVLGTASTFNTQIVQSLDNNILLNYSGSNVSAVGGGITVLSGTPSGVASTWSINSNGVWSANTGILTSAVTVSNGNLTVNGGGAMISGSTNLYQIFATAGSGVQTVGQGTNIATGGTVSNPTISTTASLTINAITASGSSTFNGGLSANTLSGGTILSGSTNLYSIFAQTGQDLTTASNGLTKSGFNVTLGGTLTAATAVVLGGNALQLSGEGASSTIVAWSGAPYYTRLFVNGSGSQLKTTFGTLGNNFFLASDTTTMNFADGGTGIQMIMKFDGVNMFVTDNINSRGLEYVTDYSSNFLPNSLVTKTYVNSYVTGITSAITSTNVQPGSNITTGGTPTVPVINLVASPSVNNFTASGNTSLQGTSGTTIYASQFFQMTPYTGANPSSPNDNDAWFHSGTTGTITLNYRVGGSTKSVELT